MVIYRDISSISYKTGSSQGVTGVAIEFPSQLSYTKNSEIFSLNFFEQSQDSSFLQTLRQIFIFSTMFLVNNSYHLPKKHTYAQFGFIVLTHLTEA